MTILLFMRRFSWYVLFCLMLLIESQRMFLMAQTEAPDALYKKGIQQIEAGQFEDAWQSIKTAHELAKNNLEYARWFMRLSFYLGGTAVFADDHDTALTHFNAALAAKQQLTTKKDSEYLSIERFIQLTHEHAQYSKNPPEYIFAIQVLYIKHTDIQDTFDAKGKPVTGKGTMDDSVLKTAVFSHNALKFYVEALSKGRLSLSFERAMVDTTLTRATIYVKKQNRTMFRPDFSSTTESLGPVIFAGRNKFDAIFYYFLNPNFDVWPYANGVHATWVPYTWYGPSRPSLTMPMGKGGIMKNSTWLAGSMCPFTLFHEFFHIVERRCGGISPMHAWQKENIEKAKQYFPNWVPDMNPAWTATEYSWYRYQFHNTVPRQLEKKAAETGIRPIFRNFSYVLREPDRTPDYLFSAYTNAIKDIAPENLRLAQNCFNKGQSLLKKKKTAEAKAEFDKAFEYNPFHFDTLRKLASIALSEKDLAKAFHYYDSLVRVYPEIGELFTIALKFRDLKAYQKAAYFFQQAAELPDTGAIYKYWQARMLIAAGDTKAAQSVTSQLKTVAVMNVSPTLITCKKAGVSLYTNANPAAPQPPILAKTRKGETLTWRIIPSEEKGWVMIVSDYNWNCLALSGEQDNYQIALEPIQDNANQQWQLDEVEKGSFRIVSRSGALALTAVKNNKAKGKSYLLTLQPSQDNALQAWKIEDTL